MRRLASPNPSTPKRGASARRSVAILFGVALSWASLFAPAQGQSLDPRSAALAGTAFGNRDASSLAANPSYLAWEEGPRRGHRRGHRLPLPLGLGTWLFDRPSFDPQTGDFEWIRAVDLGLRHPLVLSGGGKHFEGLGFGGPTGTEPSLALLSPTSLREILPRRGGDLGLTRVLGALARQWPLGQQWGTLRVVVAQVEERVQVDLRPDRRLQSWMDGDSPLPGALGIATVDTWTAANLSSGISWAKQFEVYRPAPRAGEDWREAYWNSQTRALRLAVGWSLRRSTGLFYRRYRGRLEFESTGSQLQYRPQMRREFSRARGLSGLAGTWAADLGVSLRMGGWELGAGVSDLLAEWRWPGSSVDLFETDPLTHEVTRSREGSSLRLKESGPASRWRLDLGWRGGARRIGLQADGGLGGTALRAAMEGGLGDRFVLRGGIEFDRRRRWQGGAGLLRRGSAFDFEVGLQSHAYNSSGSREIALSSAISLPWR